MILGSVSVSSFADVTLYGKIAAALEYDSFPQPNQVQPGGWSVQNYFSYFGLRGTDQVAGETAVVWQIENRIDPTSGEMYQKTTAANWVPQSPYANGAKGVITNSYNTFASSDSYVGLQGAWGRARIGNISNTFRTNTGAVDIYNGNNANSFGNYDRVMRILPMNLRYDSPSWSNFIFSAYYSFNQDGNFNVGGSNGNGAAGGADMNTFNGYPIFGAVLAYQPGNFSVTWNNQMWQNVGQYVDMGGSSPAIYGNQTVSQPYNAFVSRLELGYNNRDSWFIGAGAQITQGLGWFSQPGFGNMNNVWINNPQANGINNQYVTNCNGQTGYCALNVAVLSTAEAGVSFGWHINNWTPKIGYMYGANMMAGGNPWNIISGNNQLGNTGYQQFAAELDWNITPRTIAFVSTGQIWYGSSAYNLYRYNPTNNGGTGPDSSYMANNATAWNNNFTTAFGLSHTF